MPRQVNIQTNFSVGELDPLLRSRVDLKQYYNALQTATNVLIQPQGGVKRRDGLKYIAELPSSASPEDGVRLIPFEYSIDDSYMFAVTHQKIFIFKNKTLQTNINSSGNNYLAVSAITSAMLSKLKYTQLADTMIFTHNDLQPLKIVRGGDDSTWTTSNISFTNIPKYSFTLYNKSPLSATLTPNKISGNIQFDSGSGNSHSATAQAGSSNTITLDTGANSADDYYNGLAIEITSGTGSGQYSRITDYVGSTKVATVYPAWSTNPSSDSAFAITMFNDGDVGQYLNNSVNFGRARIIEVESSTRVHGYAEAPFFDTGALASGDWDIEFGYEESWSTARGWPTSATFHESRLYFGGSKSLPTNIWGSRVSDYFNFDLGESLDDEGLNAELTTDSLNSIQDIFSGRDLQIFTSGGEFYLPQTSNDPITPSNLMIKIGTRNGIKPGVPVAGLDSGTIFVQRSGKSLNEMVFTDTELAYTTATISLLSSHLLKSPVDMAIRRATSTEESDRLFLVNGDDGSISCYSILRSQNVIAPSTFTTEGTFEAVGVDVDDIYTVIKREIQDLQATCTITVTDYTNIATGSTIVLTKNDGTTVTFTCQGAGTGTPDTDKFFHNESNDTTADNIYTAINAHADFTVANPAANVVTVTRAARGNKNLIATSSDTTRLATTNFTGGATTKYFVEVFDNTLHTDSSVYATGSNSTGTAAHLPYTIFDIVNDGNVEAQQTSNSSGVITFSRASVSNYQIGIPFTVSVKTMPVEPRLPSGSVKGFKKRIIEVNAELYQSKAMTVNNQLVPFRQFGESVLDTPVQSFTGIKKIGPLLGYNYEGSITISQSVPLDLNVLALDYLVSLGQ